MRTTPRFRTRQKPARLLQPSQLEALALYLRAKAYFEADNPHLALRDAQAAAERDHSFARAYLIIGQSSTSLSQWQDAHTALRKAIQLDPSLRSEAGGSLGVSLGHLAQVLYSKKQYPQAILMWTEATELNPEKATNYANSISDSYTYIGIQHQNAREFDQAFDAYNQAIHYRPDAAWAFRNRAMVHRHRKNYDDSIRDCDEALRLDPTFATAYWQKAWAYIDQGQYEQGVAELDSAIRLKQDDDYYHDRGYCYGRLMDYGSSIADYSKAIRLNPQRARSFSARGFTYRKRGDTGRAMADFQEAIRLEPKNGEYILERGRLLLQMHRWKQGLADLETARKLGKSSAYVLNLLAWTWATWPEARIRNPRRALMTAQRACGLSEWQEGYIIDTLAAAYASLGNFPKAVEWQTKALEMIEPHNREDYQARLALYQSEKPHHQGD